MAKGLAAFAHFRVYSEMTKLKQKHATLPSSAHVGCSRGRETVTCEQDLLLKSSHMRSRMDVYAATPSTARFAHIVADSRCA